MELPGGTICCGGSATNDKLPVWDMQRINFPDNGLQQFWCPVGCQEPTHWFAWGMTCAEGCTEFSLVTIGPEETKALAMPGHDCLGLTMASAARQSLQMRDRQTHNRRSPAVNFGRFLAHR